MFEKIWQVIAIPLGFIMRYCYIFVQDVLHLPLAYVFALLLFTIITKGLLFPLSLKQQRSTAMMAAYKPMIDEIQKKYANDKNKQQEELQRLQQEYGYNPLSGCLPLLIQFPIIFGLIEVIYNPLTYMLRIPSAILTQIKETASALITSSGGTVTARFLENDVLRLVKTNTSAFTALAENNTAGVTSAEFLGYIKTIESFDMSIGSINLYETPSIKSISLIIIIPIFSVVTMLLSQFISTRLSGQAKAGGKQMMPMLVFSTVLFGVFSFMYPAGFSLYWGMQNLVIIAQSFILRKICDPEKLAAEAQAKIAAQRKSAKKATVTTVKIKDENGEVVEKTLSVQELEKLRLQKAREQAKERYGE